jgi:hypothetical protein
MYVCMYIYIHVYEMCIYMYNVYVYIYIHIMIHTHTHTHFRYENDKGPRPTADGYMYLDTKMLELGSKVIIPEEVSDIYVLVSMYMV